jgi:SNF2 family DNA or RNA helicase
VSLYPFQQEDVSYLQDQASALIANEMGTGKTFEAIARDAELRRPFGFSAPTLVVAPLVTLESVWQRHFEELTSLSVVALDPRSRNQTWNDWKEAGGDVFLAHWEALRLMPQLTEIKWGHIIADECHRMKNRRAQQTRALKAIPAYNKTAMSGTPVVNRPDELWSILNWLWPREYSSYWRFFNRYVATEVDFAAGRQFRKVIGPKNVDKLQAAVKPFYVRRLKTEVLPELPEKYHTEIRVTLTPQQRKAYNTMRDEMIAWIGEQEEDVLPAPVVVAQLTRLQQFACAYAEMDDQGRVRLSEPSSKLDALMDVLDEAGSESVVVFSRFRSLIDLLVVRLTKAGISHVAFTGDTPQAHRAHLVDQFQDGHARVFAGTIGAGGVGLTLTAASTVVFIDREWSPAANGQAEDRLHRIGQQNAVNVIDVIARNTVEPKKMRTLETKRDWIRRMLGDQYEG